jgi:hypothetical protein
LGPHAVNATMQTKKQNRIVHLAPRPPLADE